MSEQIGRAIYEGPVTGYAGVSGQSFRHAARPSASKSCGRRTGPITRSSAPAGFAAAYDKYGTPISPADGELTAGWSPIYVVTR